MQKIMQCFVLFFCWNLIARDCNLVIIVDNLQQETAKTEEINMTHQVITALQQRASAVLISMNLWKNIVDRKKHFEKELQNQNSLSSTIFALYQRTNQELQQAVYNLALVNQKLSHAWFFEHYKNLAELSTDVFNQLRFDFLCYTFSFDASSWSVYNAHEGMLLFVPQGLNYQVHTDYKILDGDDFLKHFHKKSHVIQSLQKLFPKDQNRWVVYLTGHGHPESSQQGANIAGLHTEEFKDLLSYFHTSENIHLLVYASCYGGGVHTVEPYANFKFNYPIIVTALTDAPIFGFGLFEGVKLPPYDEQFKLEAADVAKNKGLLPCAMQNYSAFFKRAWRGNFDLNLVQSVSKFFGCDLLQCYVQKIENYPLIRKTDSLVFTPIEDSFLLKVVQVVTEPHAVIIANKPLLVYAKKIKKIKLDRVVPIVSMLPGISSHEVTELLAPQVGLSLLLSQSFLSLEDMQNYKNFMIKKLVCFNDLIEDKKTETLTDVLIIGQEKLRPKFVTKKVDALIYAIIGTVHYLFLWDEQKIIETMILNQDQIAMMQDIQNFVQQSIDYQAQSSSMQQISFDAYQENKLYQQKIVDDCVKVKVCKKVS